MPTVYFAPDKMCTTLKLETKRLQDYFVANGWSVVDQPENADKIICGVCVGWSSIENASLQSLKDYSVFGDKVAAVGCVEGLDPELVKKVDPGRSESLYKLSLAEELIQNPIVNIDKIPEPSTFRSPADYRLYDLSKRFVNVALGCSFNCSYCLHKKSIGDRKSRTLDHILEQIKFLVEEGGVKTIVLTGLETGMYGREIGTNFPSLLNKVLDSEGNFDIAVGQFHPSGFEHFESELTDLFSNPRIVDLQVPIQSTSSRLLALMNRPSLPSRIGQVLKEISTVNPGIVLRTDLIVGFPSESFEEFSNSVDFAAEYFDEISIYCFESKKGLAAAKVESIVPKQEIERRKYFAIKVFSERGKLFHSGSQKDERDLDGLEQKRENQRKSKMKHSS